MVDANVITRTWHLKKLLGRYDRFRQDYRGPIDLAMFAMIKTNYEEILRFWKDGVAMEGRRYLLR